MTTQEQLEQVRNQPAFATLTAKDQYNQQREMIINGLMGVPEFRALNPQAQVDALKKSINEGVDYVYEDPQMARTVNETTARILAGDEEASRAATGYIKGSYTNEKMPMAVRLGMGAAMWITNANKHGDSIWGVPGEYYSSGLNTSKTRGADDNKARAELAGVLTGVDPGMAEELSSFMKTSRGIGIAGMVGQGISVGTTFGKLAPLATGVETSAKAAATGAGALRAGAQQVARQLPNIATEAIMEGGFGILESAIAADQAGETFTGGNAAGSFAMYAGGDVAFNALMQTMGPFLKYAISPWSRRVKGAMGAKTKYNNQEIFNMLDELRRGETPLELTQLSDQPALADHLQTVKKYWEIDSRIDGQQSREILSEADKALYDSFELGYDMIPLENGKVRVRANGNLEDAVEYNNIYDAKKAIGGRMKPETIEKMDFADEAARAKFISEKSHILNYGFMADSLDGHATQYGGVPEGQAAKTFRDAGNRQYITPGEADDMTGAQTPGKILRFREDGLEPAVGTRTVSDAKGKKKQEKFIRSIFTEDESVAFNLGEMDEGGNILVHAHSPANADDLNKAMSYAEEVRVREGLDIPAERIVKDHLIEAGYDSAIDAQGQLHHFFPERIKVVSDFVDPRTGRIGQSAYAKAASSQAKVAPALEMKAKGQVTASARKLGNSPKAFTQVASTVLSGETSQEGIEGLARAYAGRMGGKGLKSSMEIRLADVENVKMYKKGGKLIIEAPETIATPQQARKVFNDLTLGLEKQFPVSGAKSRKTYTDAFRKSQQEFMLPMTNSTVRDTWVKGLAEINGTPLARNGGWYQVKLKDGSVVKTRSADDVARALVLDYTDPDLLKYDMLAQGFKLTKLPDGLYKVSTTQGVELAKGTFKQVSDSVGYNPSKLPASLAPDLVVENKVPGLTMKLGEGEVVGSKQQVDEYMSMFEDYNRTLKVAGADVKKTGETMLKHSHVNYEVRVPQIGYVQSFDNMAEARKFFNGEWKSLANLNQAALKKGARLDYADGGWRLRGKNQTYHAKTSAELYDSLKRLPTPTYEKNILPDTLDSYLDSIGKRIDIIPGDFSSALDAVDAIPKFDIGNSAAHVKGVFDDLRPAVKVIRNHFMKSGDKAGAKMFEDLMNGIDGWVADARPADAIINRVFRDSKGKIISDERRKGIAFLLEAKDEASRQTIMKTPEFNLDESDFGRYEQMRNLWDTLGKKAQFDQKIFLQNYLPQVRAKVNTDLSMEQVQPLSKDYLKDTFQNNQSTSRELNMLYRLERTADMARVIRNTDAMDLALTYNKIVHRDLHLNTTWKRLYEHVNKGIKDGTVNAAQVEQLNLFRERLVSPQMTPNQRAIDGQMKKFLTAAGLDPKSGSDLADLFTKWHYRTAMSYRPWLPFRNLYQTHVILPLKTGSMRPVNRAIRTFVKNPEAAIEEMVRRGIATESDSVVDQLREFHKAKNGAKSNILDKVFEPGMKRFGRSDMITRGVAWLSSKDLLGQGLAAFKKSGDINDFVRKSRLEVFHPNIQQQVLGYVQAGQIEAAENYFGKQMIRSTMFDYRAINRPLAQKGFVGKVALQYGTHPINAMEALIENFSKYGSKGAAAKGLLAAGASSAALGLTFKALGVKNSSFLLFQQPLFSGGPGFKLLAQAPLLADPSYRGDQARRDFSRTFLPASIDKESGTLSLQYPQMLPGFYQSYYFGEGAKYAMAGKPWEAFLSFMTVPIDKDRRNLVHEETGGAAGG